MSTLADKRCDVCFSATRPLTHEEIEPFAAQVTTWIVVDDRKLHRTIKTKNFVKALELANKIGALAEVEKHHPDLLVRWGELKIDIWTHKVDGLTEADFVLAAKIDLICPA